MNVRKKWDITKEAQINALSAVKMFITPSLKVRFLEERD